MRIRIIVQSPPFDLGNREIMDNKPAPDPLVLGAQPELAEDEGWKRERPQVCDLIRELLIEKTIRVDMVPGLPYLHNAKRRGFEYLALMSG